MFSFVKQYDGPIVAGLEKFETVYARDQTQYRPLRTLPGRDGNSAIARFHFTEEQRKAIYRGADIYLELLHFKMPLTPSLIMVMSEPTYTDSFRSWWKAQTKGPYQLDNVPVSPETKSEAQGPTEKPTNPKDAVGIKKFPVSTISGVVMAELSLAMMEGARKYGRHNWRVKGIRGSVYYDAAMRHLISWWEGEDTDPDSGLSHITKTISSLMVLRDAMIQNKFTDDRPPKSPPDWMKAANEHAEMLLTKFPEPKAPYTEINNDG